MENIRYLITSDIVQAAAVCGESDFNIHVYLTPQSPITFNFEASTVIGITI